MNTSAVHPAPVRHAGPGTLWAALRRYDPLLRNGHLLTVSSLLTAGVGAAYWALAAHLYGPEGVGRTFAAVSAVMFLAGIGQLNLSNTMIRFIAPAGRRTHVLVLRAYLAAAGAAVLCGAGFVLLVPHLSSGLAFLHAPLLGTGFAVATGAYAIFVLQDGVLTGLRRADWVVAENALFAAVKILFLVLLAGVSATTGILGSWGAGLVISLAFTNAYVFARAIPRHEARTPQTPAAEPRAARTSPTPRYLVADWTGSLCWLAAITLPPIIVLDRLGARASAYFSIAWLIGYALYQFAINMCASLIVEAADDPARLRRHCRHLLRHVGALLGGAVLVVLVGAPWLLALFGADYARGGSTVLRLLALSALPNLLVTVAVAVCRVRRRMLVPVAALGALVGLVLGLTVLLLPPMGIAGAGLAWLLAQCAVAGVLLVGRSWWLPPLTDGEGPDPAGLSAALRGLLPIRRPALLFHPADKLTAHRLAHRLGTLQPRPTDPTGPPGRRDRTARGPVLRLVGQGESDALVLRLEQSAGRAFAVKHPRNGPARTTLANESRVLRQLAGDSRLGDWRELLPTAVECRLDGPLPLTVEDWLTGVPAAELMRRRPQDIERLAALSLDAITGLHRATGRLERTDSHLDAWVDRPLAALARLHPTGRASPTTPPTAPRSARQAGLAALGGRLHRGLADRTMRTAWTHADFHAGNVLLAEDGTRVTGVIDWGDARPDGPCVLDLYQFLLTLRCRTAGQELGEVMVDLLRTGSLSPQELELLAAADPGPPGRASPTTTPPDSAALPLLAWLWHVTANLAKSPRYGRSRWWVARNIRPVLEEAARWPAPR